jgi:hypothetical protein
MRNVSQGIVRALPGPMIGGWFVVIACAISSPVTPSPFRGIPFPPRVKAQRVVEMALTGVLLEEVSLPGVR